METKIKNLGKREILSPLSFSSAYKDGGGFIEDKDHLLQNLNLKSLKDSLKRGEEPLSFEMAGPRRHIYFDPDSLKCAILTCGGLCPGLNDVIRSLVIELYHRYGVRSILGIPHGLQGFISEYGHRAIKLDLPLVERILDMGGSILGSSRGPQDFNRICAYLQAENIDILFMIGGDGTLSAAHILAGLIEERGLDISVIGIPKTIDNDIYMVERSFGFDTAVEEATRAIRSAHTEALAYPDGVGLIRLMGRHSGFIAATAALAQQDANFVLIPEVPFDLYGENALLSELEKRLEARGHAVIVLAEGAGQDLFSEDKEERDASGNLILKDVGLFLKKAIEDYFAIKGRGISMKYIDPSYMIRSLPANANDSVFCSFLARNAVHAAMAGKSDMLVSYVNGFFVHLPLALCAARRKYVDPRSSLWQAVLETTGQGDLRAS